MNRYKVLLPLTVHVSEGSYTQGDTFATEFTAEQEATNLASGLLELEPNEYRVIGGSTVHGHGPGETFTMALPLGQEELLVAGGHIERVEQEPEKPKRKREAK